MTDTLKYKGLLERRQKELTLRLEHIEDLLDDPKDQDFGDGAIEREGDEVLEAQGNNGQHELDAINAALNRINAGSFGHCVKCENAISEERLAAVPFAPTCRNCMAG